MVALDKALLTAQLGKDLTVITTENSHLAAQLSAEEIATLAITLQEANRIFVTGAGRTGLMMKAIAMRLMHLGFTVYVVGETTTPAIQQGDVLLAASGSGTTNAIVNAAKKAHAAGAIVAAISATGESPLSAIAQSTLVIPANRKQDFGGARSAQYAGSLFEQSVLLTGDALFQSLWLLSNVPAEEIWKQHANME